VPYCIVYATSLSLDIFTINPQIIFGSISDPTESPSHIVSMSRFLGPEKNTGSIELLLCLLADHWPIVRLAPTRERQPWRVIGDLTPDDWLE
jgi:hypothetical protein